MEVDDLDKAYFGFIEVEFSGAEFKVRNGLVDLDFELSVDAVGKVERDFELFEVWFLVLHAHLSERDHTLFSGRQFDKFFRFHPGVVLAQVSCFDFEGKGLFARVDELELFIKRGADHHIALVQFLVRNLEVFLQLLPQSVAFLFKHLKYASSMIKVSSILSGMPG